jgi:hypothetical protein
MSALDRITGPLQSKDARWSEQFQTMDTRMTKHFQSVDEQFQVEQVNINMDTSLRYLPSEDDED